MSRELLPPDPAPELFTGLVGEVVELFKPTTEAAPAAIALQFLVALGNALGRAPHFFVGETRHGLNENLLIVGRSSRARKGDGKNAALRAVEEADLDWAVNVASGLSSGEGVIHHVRDPLMKTDKNGEEVVVDPGVADKRLLVVETEFSQPLKMFRREGNTLSNVLRDAWDGKRVLRTLTKGSPTRATEAHLSVIGHTTPEDLRAYLSNLEAANGLGNRFLFALVDRAGLIPHPPRVPPERLAALVAKIREVLVFGATVGRLSHTAAARAMWAEFYPALTIDRPGLAGQLLARAEAHVVRLCALYALCAQAREVDAEHLTAAVAAWGYCRESVLRIFASRTGNDAADRIRAELLPGQEVSLRELRADVFANHISAGRLRDALELLVQLGEVRVEQRETSGRPAVMVVRLEPSARADDFDSVAPSVGGVG